MTIEVKNTPNQGIDVLVRDTHQEIGVKQEVILVPVYENVPEYDGDYSVTPMVDAQTMRTRGKVMRDDVTVKAIPVYNVSNTAGGSTFYIATIDETPDGGRAILG